MDVVMVSCMWLVCSHMLVSGDKTELYNSLAVIKLSCVTPQR